MKWWRATAASLCLGASAGALGASGFDALYQAALVHDPSFRAARQELAAQTHAVSVAHAGLMPSVSLSISNSHVVGSRTIDNPFGQPIRSDLDYRAPQAVLSMRAPLFNDDARQRYRQAITQLRLAEQVLTSRNHDLLDRLAQAYLQRLLAEGNRVVARAQWASAQARRQMATRRLELGEGTRPEQLSADADTAIAAVQLTDADNQVAIAALTLQQLTGLAPLALEGTSVPSPGAAQEPPRDLSYWLDLAETANPALEARRLALELARLGVARASAGHLPRLDLVASASASRNDSVSTLNQSLVQRTLGLQLNIPLYSGGSVVASVAQTQAELEKAQADLDAERQSVQSEVNRLYLALVNAVPRLDAHAQSVRASALTLEAARQGFARGIRVQPDVDQARQKLAESERDLLRARYEMVLAQIRLRARAGMAPADLAALAERLMAGTSSQVRP